MRAAGFPARVVTGFQGTDSEPVDGYYVVRQSSAHAWAEYWKAGTGLGARQPDRRRRARPDRPEHPPATCSAGLMAGAIAAMSPELFANLRSSWEAINNRWNQWVLNYTRGQQLDALRNLGFTAPDWQDLALLLIGLLSTLALAGAAWPLWLDRHRVDPSVRQLERLQARPALARHRRGAARGAAHPRRARARSPRRAAARSSRLHSTRSRRNVTAGPPRAVPTPP